MCVDVSHVLKGPQFMTFMGFPFLMTGRYCCCTVHPNHPLHSHHGFVFCFINYIFYLWKHMGSTIYFEM